jgi:hypothetical protein
VNYCTRSRLGANPDGATTHDILGLRRDEQPDVGAFEYSNE